MDDWEGPDNGWQAHLGRLDSAMVDRKFGGEILTAFRAKGERIRSARRSLREKAALMRSGVGEGGEALLTESQLMALGRRLQGEQQDIRELRWEVRDQDGREGDLIQEIRGEMERLSPAVQSESGRGGRKVGGSWADDVDL